MSDFLSHLVARALGRAPVLERRRSSIFETTAETEPEVLSSLGGADHPLDLESSAPNETSPPSPMPDRSLPRATIASAEEEHEIAPDRPARRRPVAENPSVNPATVLPNESRKNPLAPPRLQPERIERKTRSPLRVIKQISATEPASAQALRRPPSLTLVSVRKGEKDTQPVPRPKSDAKPIDLAPILPPSIQISIGRLEIRATTPPPAPAARPRPTSPRLSLEDYLRARSGGRR